MLPRSDGKVALEAPDLEVETEWSIDSLPWNLLPVHADGSRHQADKELDMSLLQALETMISLEVPNKRSISGQVAFLYIYMVMAGSQANA